MNKKAIVYSVDDSVECLLQLTMSLKSVRRLSKEPIDIFICTNKPKRWMQGLYGAKILDVSSLVENYGLSAHNLMWRKHPVSPMLLFRLLIPVVKELQGYEQVLYLDTDTEVWDPEFFDIFSMNKECEVIAVQDSLHKDGAVTRISDLRRRGGNNWKDDDGIFNRWDEIISRKDCAYANSGVLVFNMNNFKNDYDARIRYIIDKIKKLKPFYPDQDALNIYYRIFIVSDRRYDGWGRSLNKIRLRHYVGNDRKKSPVYPVVDMRRPTELLDGIQENKDLGVLSGVVDHVYILVDDKDPSNSELLIEWFALNGVSKVTKIDTNETDKYKGMLEQVPYESNFKAAHLDNWMGHYRAIVDAINNGYERVAIFEDTFIPRGLENNILELPNNFDVAICTNGNGRFKPTTDFMAESSKCYIIGKKGMVDLRRLFESLWDPEVANKKLRYVHRWLSNKILIKQRVYIRTNNK